MDQLERDNMYMEIAETIGRRSYCERSQVGAVVVKGDTIIGIGYNGTPSGFENRCEDNDGNTRRDVLHAESNAIAKCARNTISTVGATLYTTMSPCYECAKIIIQCGIERVVFCKYYRDNSALDLLRKANVKLQKNA